MNEICHILMYKCIRKPMHQKYPKQSPMNRFGSLLVTTYRSIGKLAKHFKKTQMNPQFTSRDTFGGLRKMALFLYLTFILQKYYISIILICIIIFCGEKSPLCGATGALCFILQLILPMGFKARVDALSPALDVACV